MLNGVTTTFLIGCIFYTIAMQATLQASDNMGVLYMVGLLGVGISALFPDFLIQLFVKKKKLRLFLNLLVIAAYSILMVFV